MLPKGSRVEFSFTSENGTVSATARHGGFEGHGEASATGILGRDIAAVRAVTDLAFRIAVQDVEIDLSDEDCVDGSGDLWPEHDYPAGGGECRRCGAEMTEG